MELLEEVTWPQPLGELLAAAFETYRQGHPWVSEGALSPKSVVRDLWERAMTFGEFVAYYGLSRSEGLVLRYLTDAYRALRQTIPEQARTEELADLIEWLGEVVRQTDSSLLDEWEALTAGGEETAAIRPGDLAATPRGVTANERAFRVMVRNAMFRRVELMALRRWIDLGELDAGTGWDEGRWQEAVQDYFAEYADLGTGPDARGPALVQISKEPGRWLVRQVLDDPEGDHDWGISATIDLVESDEAGEPVLRIDDVGPLT